MVRDDRRSIHVEGGQKAGKEPLQARSAFRLIKVQFSKRAENSGRLVGAKEIVAKVGEEVKVSPGLEGEAEDLGMRRGWRRRRSTSARWRRSPRRGRRRILEGWVSLLKIRLSEG
jgi:hypothetical protein